MRFLKDLWVQLQELLAQQTVSTKIVAGLLLVGVLLLLGIPIFRYGRTIDYEVLYADLTAEQAKKVKETLVQSGELYRIDHSERNGWTIKVPEGTALDWRLNLATEIDVEGGGAKSWNIFDTKEFGVTGDELRIKEYRALRGELARTIGRMDMVRSAKVDLAIPSTELFIKDDKPPTASVLVELFPDAMLTKNNVRTIQALVAGSVEGLTRQNVTVADTFGNELSQEEEMDTAAKEIDSRTRQMDMHKRQREEYENYLEQKILDALDPVFGPGHVRANLSVSFDHTLKEETSTRYDPAPVPLSTAQTVRTISNTGGIAEGITGAVNHTEDATEAGGEGKKNVEVVEENMSNFNVGVTETTTVHAPYSIMRITASVVVDDKPTRDTDKDGNATVVRKPIEDKRELEKISNVVKGIINFNEKRLGGGVDEVFVSNISFTPDIQGIPSDTLEKLEQQRRYSIWIKYGLVFAIVVLIILFIARPLVQIVAARPLAQPALAGPEIQALAGQGEMDFLAGPEPELTLEELRPDALPQSRERSPDVMSDRHAEIDDEILELAKSNPKKVVLVLRSWLEI
ncbi:flagellar M-ring protein FliF [bacterium]|nr:flagellar M-ring protein FliF [bacterium]